MFVFWEKLDGFLNQFELFKKKQWIPSGQETDPIATQEVQAES
jgi:hypothetical protein